MKIGNFTIDQRLAAGGMGEVWLGTHVTHGTPVAIKVMTNDIALHPDFHEQFRREVEATARLHHPGIVTVYDFGVLPEGVASLGLVQNSPYFVMEFVEGGSLVAQVPKLDWQAARSILEDVLAALAHGHARGVIHRDIKPDNILLGRYPNGEARPVLTDFGIAYAMERNTTTTGSDHTERNNEDMSGTPLYMAPEQFRGEFRDYGPWTDLYAVGVIAWEIVTGKLPFVSKSPFHLARLHMMQELPEFVPRFEVPEGFEKWVRRLLAKAPRNRYRAAADARWALKVLQNPDHEFANGSPSEAELNDMPTMFMPIALPEGSTEVPPPPRDWRDADLRSSLGELNAGLGLFGIRTIPFIGREEERTALWRAFLEVSDHRKPRAVVVRGLAGTGKSRLAEWLYQTTQESGAAVGFRAVHQAEPGPMHGLSWMLTEHFRCAGLRPKDLRDRVAYKLSQLGEHDERGIDSLSEIMRVERIDSGDERSRKTSVMSLSVDQRLEVIGQTVVRAAEDRIAVVWLDDAIWDRESIHFVQRVLDRAQDPILFILTVREEALAEDARAREALDAIAAHRRLSTINLHFFDDETFERLVRDGLMLTGSAAAVVTRQCDGSPLYATQLVEFWLRRGALVAREGRIELVDTTVEAPKSIATLWQSRLDHLVEDIANPPENVTSFFITDLDIVWKRLELAAALGRDVDIEEWDHAAKMYNLPAIPRIVDALVEARLAERTAVGFSFVHGLLRDALAARARDQRRWKRLNLTCARMLTSRYSQEHPGLAFRVARHFVEAKNATFAQIALHEAFERETANADPGRVVEVCRLMRDALERAETPADHPMWLRLWTVEGRTRVSLAPPHEVERGEELIRQAVDAAAQRGSGLELARALAAVAYADFLRGDYQEAQASIEEALTHAPDEAARVEVLRDAIHIYNAMSLRTAALQSASLILDFAKRTDTRIHAHLALAEAARMAGSYAEALFELEVAEQSVHSDALWVYRAQLNLVRGRVYEDMHESDSARAAFEAAFHELKESGSGLALQAQELYARCLVAGGQLETARPLFDDLERRLRVGERGREVHPWDGDLWLATLSRDWRRFESVVTRAFAFQGLPPRVRHFRTFAAICQSLDELGETERARRVSQDALMVIETTNEGRTWADVFRSRLQN